MLVNQDHPHFPHQVTACCCNQKMSHHNTGCWIFLTFSVQAWQYHLHHVCLGKAQYYLEAEDERRNRVEIVSRFFGVSKLCWARLLTEPKASGTELLSLLSLASGTGEKVVAVVIGSPSKHCLHMGVLQELLLQASLSFPVQPACMHSFCPFKVFLIL
jgi:hypothetical protein